MYRFIYKSIFLIAITLASQISTISLADTVSEYTIKAAFIYNFAKFTQWPDSSNEINICIYGKDPFGSDIDSLNGKTSNGRTIKIVRTKLIGDVKSCHIAFLNIIPPERRLFENAIKEISGHSILTVSDASNVIRYGVMIGLIIENNRVSFEVNNNAVKSSHLQISAQLLRLAKGII